MVTLPKTHSAFDLLFTVTIFSSLSEGTNIFFLYFANLQLRSFNEVFAVACKFRDLTIQL
jgi:hypothetical protein